MKHHLISGLASRNSTLVSKDLQKFNCGYDSETEIDSESEDGENEKSLLLTPHANGTTSEVFRANPPSLSVARFEESVSQDQKDVVALIRAVGGIQESICLKRVIIQGQPKPHDVVREIRCLLKINRNHANIIPLLAAFFDESEPFSTKFDLVFPFYPLDLSQLLDEPTFSPFSNSISTPQLSGASYVVDPIATAKEMSQKFNNGNYIPYVKSIYKQLLSALVFLHDELSISHRDLKPSNVLLSLNGTPILTDFGTAWEERNDVASFRSSTAQEIDWLSKGRVGDDGERGSILPNVGSGSFRPPELLLSPLKGYDPKKVDLWALGVTISSFFTEIIEFRNSNGLGGAFDGEEDESLDYWKEEEAAGNDDIPQWEKDLFEGEEDERTKGPQEFNTSRHDYEEEFELDLIERMKRDEEDQFEPRMKFHRLTLFDGSRGDIGLMGSIFNIRGLTKEEKDWPEATQFQPNLTSLPFEARPKTDLLDHLPLAKRLLSSPSSPSSSQKSDPERSDQIKNIQDTIRVIDTSLQLSASKRPSAKAALEMLESK